MLLDCHMVDMIVGITNQPIFGISILGWALIGLVLIMVVQQYSIAWISQKDNHSENENESWNRVASQYVWHRYWTYWASFFAFAVALSVSFALIFNHSGGEWLADEYISFLKEATVISVFALGLISAVARWIMDLQVEFKDNESLQNGTLEKPKGLFVSARNLLVKNWNLNWLVVSVLIGGIVAFFVVPQAREFVRSSDELGVAWTAQAKEYVEPSVANESNPPVNEAQAVADEEPENKTSSTSNVAGNPIAEAFLRQLNEVERQGLTGVDLKNKLNSILQSFHVSQASILVGQEKSRLAADLKLASEEFVKAKAESVKSPDDQAKKDKLQSVENEVSEIQKQLSVFGTTDQATSPQKGSNATEPQALASENSGNAVNSTKVKNWLKDKHELREPPAFAGLWLRHRFPAIAIAACVWGIFWFAWYRWVWYHIHKNLREKHLFRGPAVSHFMKQRDALIPSQVVVIGPKHGGKSALIEALSGAKIERSTSRTSFYERVHGGYLHSFCDMPGEEFGTHVKYMIGYRIDWLVIVLRGAAFLNQNGDLVCAENELIEKISKLESISEVCSEELWRNNRKEEDTPQEPGDGIWTKQYFTTLNSFMKAGELDNDTRSLLKRIDNLMIVLNYDADEPNERHLRDVVSGDDLLPLAADFVSRIEEGPPRNARNCVVANLRNTRATRELLNLITPNTKLGDEDLR